MSIRKLFAGAVLGASLLAPLAGAAEPHAGFCMFASFQVTQVGSLYRGERSGRGDAVQRFAGARLFLPAQPGLTREWIQASLARHAADQSSAPDCPLDVPGVKVAVSSAGTGFWVEISASSTDGARQVLERARLLVR